MELVFSQEHRKLVAVISSDTTLKLRCACNSRSVFELHVFGTNRHAAQRDVKFSEIHAILKC